MKYVETSNYDKTPYIEIKDIENAAWAGYGAIIAKIREDISRITKKKIIVVVDAYPGINEKEIFQAFEEGLKPIKTVYAKDACYDYQKVEEMLSRNITEDRVFGVLSCHKILEFFNMHKMNQIRQELESLQEGVVLILGEGASLVMDADILIYADLARWEIQRRYRNNEIANWLSDNYEEDPMRKYKRGFFIDWRVHDRHKKSIWSKMDYVLDTNTINQPKMMTAKLMFAGLEQATRQPFRVVPFFDPGVWGGQWMKEVCDLEREETNYAWCFDCVPEENSLLIKCEETILEIPSINLVLFEPIKLLGDKVHARFGAEFPIRFDFLDTMEGQNLSLQVHPLTEYIQENFGMHYTQDESYYILDAREDVDTFVFLGLKEKVDGDELIHDLEVASQIGTMDVLKYVNKIPAKKHDHFLIPAGTIHCSGANTMVLEISATPYIFTFKLWDWDRLGLDGRPRPVHIEHGKRNIQFDRDTQWILDNCVNHIEKLEETNGCMEERTGLHQREFIETRRHWFSKKVHHHTNDGVNVLNLIEGEEALVESPDGCFEPYLVHYAETFIVPASVGAYSIRPFGKSENKKIATIKAFVRT